MVEMASPNGNGTLVTYSDFGRTRSGRVDHFRLGVCSIRNFLFLLYRLFFLFDFLIDFEFLSDFLFDFLWVFLRVFFYPSTVTLVWVVGISRYMESGHFVCTRIEV